MRAITFRGEEQVVYEEVPDPSIVDPTDVIVAVELCAVCGSDLHVYHGREKGLDSGTVMGHEFVGTVAETGSEVGEELAVGRRVLSPFTTSCGACFYCRQGLTSRCIAGALFGWVAGGRGLQGGQAEYVRVPLAATTLLPIPEGVDVEPALLLGDVFSTGYFCARQAGVAPEGVYAVLGCGPVGLSAVIAARSMGASSVFAFDAVAERLALAETLGAVAVDYRSGHASAAIAEATEGRGADAVMELVGTAAAHRLALDLVRPGGTLSVVGVHTEDNFSFSPADAYDKNLTYRVGRCPARAMAERLLPEVRDGRFDLRPLVSHRWPLARGAEAYQVFDAKRDGCIKIVMTASPPD